MPFDIGIPELLVVFGVVLMVFGPDKIPELARGLGGMVRELRKAATEMTRDFTAELGDPGPQPAPPRTQAVCPHCSGLNPVGNQFCGHCGAEVA